MGLSLASLVFTLFPAVLPAASPFCADESATREYFRRLCDYIVQEKSHVPVIFTGGYYLRALVAGYKIFGTQRYLETAIAYGDELLQRQSPRGYWLTGYGKNVYLADTGSALGLLLVLYPHVDQDRQKRYFDSVQRYVEAIEKDGLIRPSGALDVGLRGDKDTGALVGPFDQDYTTSSALTGGEIFTWMYHRTGREKYRQIAYRTQTWILSTMREDGIIPYNHPSGGSDLRKKGDAKNDFMLWTHSLYLNSAYVGEGLLSFDLYCGRPEWQKEVRTRIKPHIDYLLRTQNPDGTWSVPGPWDQKRSPGIVNFLIWYYRSVDQDARIPVATRKFAAFLLVPENARRFGLLNEGALPPEKDRIAYDCVTGLTGRALADIIQPGVDVQW